MSSRTLNKILKHWNGEPIPQQDMYLELPFDIENVCRELDEEIAGIIILTHSELPREEICERIRRILSETNK